MKIVSETKMNCYRALFNELSKWAISDLLSWTQKVVQVMDANYSVASWRQKLEYFLAKVSLLMLLLRDMLAYVYGSEFWLLLYFQSA